MTPELIAKLILSAVGVGISLLFSYFPGVSTWYYKLNPNLRGIIMVGILALGSVLGYVSTCVLGWFTIIPCTQDGIRLLIEAFVIMLLSNQITYQVAPKSPAKRKILEESLGELTYVDARGFGLPLDDDDLTSEPE